MQSGDGRDATVTWQDQQNINAFGRLNNRLHELDDEIQLKKEVEANLEDAENELILTDDEEVRYLRGEVYLHMGKDDVDELLQQLKAATAGEAVALQDERAGILKRMEALKVTLYGKFGDAINLEED